MPSPAPLLRPDLSSRPFQLTTQRAMISAPGVLYTAWTEQFDRATRTTGGSSDSNAIGSLS
jgi:hypothetical protein